MPAIKELSEKITTAIKLLIVYGINIIPISKESEYDLFSSEDSDESLDSSDDMTKITYPSWMPNITNGMHCYIIKREPRFDLYIYVIETEPPIKGKFRMKELSTGDIIFNIYFEYKGAKFKIKTKNFCGGCDCIISCKESVFPGSEKFTISAKMEYA